MSPSTPARGPLHGVRVLDLTRVLAGPYATLWLWELGAEIIKVEQPGMGDDTRAFPPMKNGESVYFASVNRGILRRRRTARFSIVYCLKPMC